MITYAQKISSCSLFFLLWLFSLGLGVPGQLAGQPAHELKKDTDAALLGAGGVSFGLSIPLQKRVFPLTEEEIREQALYL